MLSGDLREVLELYLAETTWAVTATRGLVPDETRDRVLRQRAACEQALKETATGWIR